jgi:hypothetical protein
MKVRTKLFILHLKNVDILTSFVVAISVATGKFVWWAGGYFNTNDAKIYQTAGLADKFERDPDTNLLPRRGIADRGYFAKNPNSKLHQCLWAAVKAQRDEYLSESDRKVNQVLSTVRIQVEQAIGRLKCLQRLVCSSRSSRGNLEELRKSHRVIFNVCINFTNHWMKSNPIRKKPHWLLCKGPIPTEDVENLIQGFYSIGKRINLRDYVPKHLEALEQYPEEDEELEEE